MTTQLMIPFLIETSSRVGDLSARHVRHVFDMLYHLSFGTFRRHIIRRHCQLSSGILGTVSSCEPPPPPPTNPHNVFINLPFNYKSSTSCIIAACPHSMAHVLTTEAIQQSHYDMYHPNILKMLAEGTKNVRERLNCHLCALHGGAICL